MKIGIIVYSNDPETVWNAFRFGNFALAMGDRVNIFFLGSGVEFESLDKDVYNITEQKEPFLASGGMLFACGTCLEIHGLPASGIYKVSTLDDLYEIVKGSDRVITF